MSVSEPLVSAKSPKGQCKEDTILVLVVLVYVFMIDSNRILYKELCRDIAYIAYAAPPGQKTRCYKILTSIVYIKFTHRCTSCTLPES